MFTILESISCNTKYLNLYKAIVIRAKNRYIQELTEKHHILPKSIGGDDSPENLVILSTREHFLCHLLLVKFLTPGQNRYKMLFALNMMRSHYSHERYFNSRLYERYKSEFKKAQQLNKLEYYSDIEARKKLSIAKNKFWASNSEKTEETRRKLSLAAKLQDRTNMDYSKAKAKGDSRTKAQKDGSKSHSKNMQDRLHYTNGEKTIRLKPGCDIPIGFRPGRNRKDVYVKIFDKENNIFFNGKADQIDNIRYVKFERNIHDPERVFVFQTLSKLGYKILERQYCMSNRKLLLLLEEKSSLEYNRAGV